MNLPVTYAGTLGRAVEILGGQMIIRSHTKKTLYALHGLILCVFIVFFASIGGRRLQAQAVAGMTGTVTDSGGAVVPQATVTIKNIDTGVTNRAITSSVGTYAVTGLLPGRYQVKVDATGFKSSVTDNVQVDIGKQSTINVTVDVGKATETVEVQADSIALDTSSPQLGTTVEPELIKALPIEVAGRGRQIDQLQFLSPGVQGGSFVHEVSGGVWFQQEVVVNGIPLPQAETEGMTTNVNPPFELVREFRVERSTFAAQYGLAQGAINYQTASGTNKFHGDLFEINRNSTFDSMGFFNPTVPKDHENNYGFTVEGPVRIPKLYDGRDRTFFHATSEWYKQQTGVQGLATVPTVQERSGDFTDFVNPSTGALIPIYDPETGLQFQDAGRLNVIPQSRISALSKDYLPFIPNPDRAGQGIGGLDNNKNPVNAANTVDQPNWGFTVDHNLTKNQTLHYAEWRNLFNNLAAESTLAAPSNPVGEWTRGYTLGSGFLLNYVNTVTPHLVATAGFGWLGEINNTYPTNNYSFPGVQNGVTAPEVTFDGWNGPTSWSTNGSIEESVNRKLGYSFENNWLWTKGRHTFNMGGEARREYQDESGNSSGGGRFAFTYRTTAAPGDFSANTGASFASFLLGQVDSASRAFSEEVRLRNFDISPYIQDDIKLNPRLTVNLGLRWDIAFPFDAVNNNLIFLDLKSPNPTAGGLPGLPVALANCSTECSGFTRATVQWRHLGPRLGAAYLLTPKTVLQAGYSLAFLKGGAYSFGDNLAAAAFSSLLAGQYTRSSIGGNVPAYGSWDAQQLPEPATTPLSAGLGKGNAIAPFSQNDGYLPYTQQWNVNLQRQLPFNTFLTLAYVGNREVHIISNLNNPDQSNPAILGLGSKLYMDNFSNGTAQADGFSLPYPSFVSDFGGSATLAQSLRPFPQYSDVTDHFEHSGSVAYNGLQAQGEKRFSSGLAFLTALTVARTMSNGDSGNGAFTGLPVNKYNQKAEWSVASSDQKYNFKISGTYQLPLGHGKPFLNKHRLIDEAVGGWQFGGILDYESGGPMGFGEITILPFIAGFPGGNRPNRISSVPLHGYGYGKLLAYALTGEKGTEPEIFNPNTFQPTSTFELGDAARNYSSVRGVGTKNENLNLAKHWAIADGANFAVQFDWFNAFNRALLSGGNTDASLSNFGYVTGVGQANSNRQGQISARIEF